MWSQRTLLALMAGLSAAAASAQAPGGLRWPGSGQAATGLQAESCGRFAFSCDSSAAFVPLYGNKLGTRSLDMRVGGLEPTRPALPLDQKAAQGMSVSLVGRADLPYDLGVYGRLGTTLGGPSVLAGSLSSPPGSGISYGVGLRWAFSERGSAVVGWDSYDLHTLAGEREVRATSLGLQWRY